jgi:hypothetical protein
VFGLVECAAGVVLQRLGDDGGVFSFELEAAAT